MAPSRPTSCTSNAFVTVGAFTVRYHSRPHHCVPPCGRRWWPLPHQFVAGLATSALRSYAACAASSQVAASCLRYRIGAQPSAQPDLAIRGFNLACRGGATPVSFSLGLMTLASVLSASAKSAKPVAMASIGNRTSSGGRPRTPSRLLDRLPEPPTLASPLASSRCAFTPGATAPSFCAVAAGGRRRIHSSPGLQHQRSGRTLLVPHRPEWAPRACVTDLRPNPAVERTRGYVASTWRA